MYFRYFLIITPSQRAGPSFVQIWIPFSQRYFVPSFVDIGPVALENKKKMWKVNDDDKTATTTTDNGQIVIRNAHLSLWLRWANKNLTAVKEKLPEYK